mmetsp:Transcript_20658/g.23909  ORF Transcript_20658/g.23909 Transcript_20658/m.23909 type:complete len:149 (-) Transcript_20658:58-504(-)
MKSINKINTSSFKVKNIRFEDDVTSQMKKEKTLSNSSLDLQKIDDLIQHPYENLRVNKGYSKLKNFINEVCNRKILLPKEPSPSANRVSPMAKHGNYRMRGLDTLHFDGSRSMLPMDKSKTIDLSAIKELSKRAKSTLKVKRKDMRDA